MSLREKLKRTANYSDKYDYRELVEELQKAATEGKYSIEIVEDEVLEIDIERLKEDGLEVEFIKGRDYNYYHISWE